jgi:hypothetical protein
MNAHRLVIIAAALTTLVAAALATALATFSGQALPRAVRHDLGHASGTSLSVSGSVNASQAAQYTSILPSQIKSALGGTPFSFYQAVWSDRSGSCRARCPPPRPPRPPGPVRAAPATFRSPRPPRWATSPARPSWYPATGPAPRSAGSPSPPPCPPRPPRSCT